jgi:sugar lactone lactonase YvrE
MDKDVRLIAIEPAYALPGGEIAVKCAGFRISERKVDGCFLGGSPCRITAASSERILAAVPSVVTNAKSQLQLVSGGAKSKTVGLTVAKQLTGDMHLVANPAVDPGDDSLILTRSGSRGQSLPVTLFRLEADGYLDEFPEPILNPTGIAFDPDGQMFVTNRAQGEVYAVGRDGMATVYATGLGIATGIAFDADGNMYVGDRAGTIFRVKDFGEVETFTVLEPSVAAYHMAFGPDGRLYVTSPGLASHDAVHVIDKEGFDEKFYTGLGRPQGLAFDKAGNLYVAACYKGHHGIVRITPDGSSCEHFVAGNNIVGLCFNKKGEMIVATNDTAYAINCGIEGVLL